jgi:hypothetical protein
MSREAIEEAIEVLEDASAEMLMETGDKNYYIEAIAVLRQALVDADDISQDHVDETTKQEHEPVAWISDSPTKGNGKQLHWTKAEAWKWSSNITPLYTTPPNREWVGLTDEDVSYFRYAATFCDELDTAYMAELIEKDLKEKNHG